MKCRLSMCIIVMYKYKNIIIKVSYGNGCYCTKCSNNIISVKALLTTTSPQPRLFLSWRTKISIHTLTLYWIDHHGDLTRWQGMKQLGLTFQLISTPSLPTKRMKGCTTPLGFMPLLFTNSSAGSFTSHKNQNRERAVTQGPWFFVLIWED